jgi:hypothetical protein
MGGNSPEDERRFATAARISEINLALYRAFAQPIVKSIFTPQVAEMMKRCDPARLQYEACTDVNPLMGQLAEVADDVRENRKPASSDNPFIVAQEAMSAQIVKSLDAWRETTEKLSEHLFLTVYGSPILQAAVGVNPESAKPRRPGKSLIHRELREKRIAELKAKINQGGLIECAVRGLLYAGAPRGAVDERGVEALLRIRMTDPGARLTVAQFKQTAREQFFLLLLEPEAALAAIPNLLPADIGERRKALAAIRSVLGSIGEIKGETAERLKKVEALFGVKAAASSEEDTKSFPAVPGPDDRKDASHRAKRH